MLGGPNSRAGEISTRFSPPLVRSLCPIQQPQVWPWWFTHSWLQPLDYCSLCSPFSYLFFWNAALHPGRKITGLPSEHDAVEDLRGLCCACLRGAVRALRAPARAGAEVAAARGRQSPHGSGRRYGAFKGRRRDRTFQPLPSRMQTSCFVPVFHSFVQLCTCS